MKFTKSHGLVLLLLFCQRLYSADVPDIEKLIDVDSENDQTALIEYLTTVCENPFNLNTVTVNDLLSLPWLTLQQANDIIAYRNKNGPLKKFSELKKIKSIDEDLYNILIHFVIIPEKEKPPSIRTLGRHRIIIPFKQAKGYQNGTYQGNALKLYNRISMIITDRYKFGVLTEKDPGESNYNDLLAGYAQIMLPSQNADIILGNFYFESGQGLVFSSPYQLSKGSDPILPAHKKRSGSRPYTLSDENSALNGISIRKNAANVQLSFFYSSQNRDATITRDSVTTILNTGLHQTITDMDKKNALNETLIGAEIEIKTGKFSSIGMTFQSSQYALPINPGNEIFDVYDFKGTTNHVSGIHYTFYYNNLTLFGEGALSKSDGKAVILGGRLQKGKAGFIFLWRNYDKNFHNFHAGSFGTRQNAQDETGFYTGVKIKFSPKLSLAYYIDIYKHHWLTQTTHLPGNGYDIMAIAEFKPVKKFFITLQYKTRQKYYSDAFSDIYGNTYYKMVTDQYNRYRIQFDYTPVRKISLRTRMEWKRVNGESVSNDELKNKVSTMQYQEIMYNMFSVLKFRVRWCLFDAPLYETRFYQYEYDHPGMMTLKMLYGRGSRFYLMAALKIKSKIKLSSKFSCTHYTDRYFIGSGNNSIDSNREHHISFQLDYSF